MVNFSTSPRGYDHHAHSSRVQLLQGASRVKATSLELESFLTPTINPALML